MGYWDRYQNRITTDGSTYKDRIVNKMKRIITNDISYSPSYFEVYINGSSSPIDAWIIDPYFYGLNSTSDIGKRIAVSPGNSLNIGDEILWGSDIWLCLKKENANGIYDRGIIQRCNFNMKYLDGTGDIISIPCILTNKVLLDLKENRYLFLPDNQVMVIVKNDSDSNIITIDKRFIFNDNAFKVIGIDNFSNEGVIYFKMESSALSDDDNLTLDIANYTSSFHTYTISILEGSAVSLATAQTLQINVECTDNGSIVTSPTVSYGLVTGSTGKISVSTSGLVTGIATGTGNILAVYENVSDTIEITVGIAPVNNYSYKIIGNIQPDDEIKYNQTKTYTATKYLNGVLDGAAIFTFSIVAGSTPSTAYTLTVTGNTTCTLKCNTYGYDIILRISDNAIPANITNKTITLKSLL